MKKHIVNPVSIIDEIDSFYRIPSLVASLGKRVLLVHGKNFLKHYGYLEKLKDLFQEKHIFFTDYSLRFFESDIRDVLSCITIIKKHKINVVLAIGGGGVIDTAKAAAGLCLEKTPEQFLYESRTPEKESLPLIAVPTTAGMPYSRETIEPWPRIPPMSVTNPTAWAKS